MIDHFNHYSLGYCTKRLTILIAGIQAIHELNQIEHFFL